MLLTNEGKLKKNLDIFIALDKKYARLFIIDISNLRHVLLCFPVSN